MIGFFFPDASIFPVGIVLFDRVSMPAMGAFRIKNHSKYLIHSTP